MVEVRPVLARQARMFQREFDLGARVGIDEYVVRRGRLCFLALLSGKHLGEYPILLTAIVSIKLTPRLAVPQRGGLASKCPAAPSSLVVRRDQVDRTFYARLGSL